MGVLTVSVWVVVAGSVAATGGACPEGPDADRDGLSDACELSLAERFAPALVVSAKACNWDAGSGRLGGGYLFGAHPTQGGVRILYLPAYFEDCGWSGAKCLLRWRGGCDPHAGDSELIVVEAERRPPDGRLAVARVFLSAHCFSRSDGDCRWYSAAELRTYGDVVRVWVAEGKNANYPTRAACDAGHWHFDTCDRNDVTVRYPVESAGQNIGSSETPFPHLDVDDGCLAAADSPFLSGRPGRECPWTDERFHGWGERRREGSTGYRRYLAGPLLDALTTAPEPGRPERTGGAR